MTKVQFSQVSLAFGDRDILKNVTINLSPGTRAALTGANGSGKTTLLKILAGLVAPDSGDCVAQKEARIAYLPQSGIVHSGCTLRQEADRAFEYGYDLEAEIEKIGDVLSTNPKNPTPLLERHHQLSEKLENSGWYRRDVLAEQVLLGLGFSREDLNRPVEEFSGGWQMRIALAKVLMQGPDILLLDEPTNYLDLEARNWLEQFLQSFAGGFLLVSHDRYFLDVTVTEVYELFNGELKRYSGNYTNYEKIRKVELDSLVTRYHQQQEEIHKLEDFIRRFGVKATKAAQAQERQKMLDKILEQKIEIPESLKKIHFSFPPAPHSGRLVVTLEGITKSYDNKHNVINDLNLVIEKNQRMVVAGRNGSGKTTLLKILSGKDSQFSGSIKFGSGVSIGYFSQDSAEVICGKQSVLEYIEKDAPLELIPKIRDLLGAFLFRGDDVYKSLDVLSGGEKSRLALLELLLRPVNLLILDEPTNHLDLNSKDVLLEALKDFGGTVVFVSHDRGFIESLATFVLELVSPKPDSLTGTVRYFPGDYNYYLDRIEAERQEQSEIVKSQVVTKKTQEKISDSPSGAMQHEEQKRLKNERRRLERREEQLLEEISILEEKKQVLENELANPSVYSDATKSRSIMREIDELTKKMDDLALEWEEVTAQLQ
ncbi:MAG: ABC-F family ATP-binding cassette domain-containing protein [Spirochaetaceae bacterium]|nr:ABC-F family ATP-binding cassette domain-containing protein [Spirochaetaceae bacterium]